MQRTLVFSSLPLLLALGCGSSDRDPGLGSDAGPGGDGSISLMDGGTSDTDSGTSAGGLAPGASCTCDDQCDGADGHAGICVQGICMQQASADCSAGGSTEECPAGSRCWGLTGFEGGICWPDCDAHTCDGTCDSDGSCVPSADSTCDDTCSTYCDGGSTDGCPPHSHLDGDGCVCDDGFTVNEAADACVPSCTTTEDCSGGLVCNDGRCEEPPCTETSCPSGSICGSAGRCVLDIGTPPPGPPPTCTIGTAGIPDWHCTMGAAACGELVPFDPDMGTGYWDYPINGETESNQYRSYVRRDVMMLVKYAAAMVACQAAGWEFGNGGPLALGDMSEADGSIPGTSIGEPGHPAGTHVDGHDMDIGYYQTGTADNRLRPVCPHTTGGSEAYHCTGDPTNLDPWRTALVLGHMHVSPQLRVIGVDGRIGPIVDSAITQLCADGWLSGGACGSRKITWEATDEGRGWFLFHLHHFHISVSSP